TLDGAGFLTIQGVTLAKVGPGDRSLMLDACTHDVSIRNVTGTTFLVLEGSARISFLGGSWGGYGAPGQEDSAIGTAGPAGPTRGTGSRSATTAWLPSVATSSSATTRTRRRTRTRTRGRTGRSSRPATRSRG